MLYVFVPYYNEDTPEFKKSLESQTVKYILIKRDRKKANILWTKSVNWFWEQSFRWQGTKDDDVICIMNNDIKFGDKLFALGSKVRKGEIFIPAFVECYIDWKKKLFAESTFPFCNCFIGRCFFMTLGDFKESGGFCSLLPHALADIDFSLKVIKKCKPVLVHTGVSHPAHPYEPISKWSLRSYNNPILWTIFLLRHPNRYTLKNILKAWYDGLFR